MALNDPEGYPGIGVFEKTRTSEKDVGGGEGSMEPLLSQCE